MKYLKLISWIAVVVGSVTSLLIAFANAAKADTTDQDVMVFLKTDKYIPLTEELSREDIGKGLIAFLQDDRIGYDHIFISSSIVIIGLVGISVCNSYNYIRVSKSK